MQNFFKSPTHDLDSRGIFPMAPFAIFFISHFHCAGRNFSWKLPNPLNPHWSVPYNTNEASRTQWVSITYTRLVVWNYIVACVVTRSITWRLSDLCCVTAKETEPNLGPKKWLQQVVPSSWEEVPQWSHKHVYTWCTHKPVPSLETVFTS